MGEGSGRRLAGEGLPAKADGRSLPSTSRLEKVNWRKLPAKAGRLEKAGGRRLPAKVGPEKVCRRRPDRRRLHGGGSTKKAPWRRLTEKTPRRRLHGEGSVMKVAVRERRE